jgi:hypothetical protein
MKLVLSLLQLLLSSGTSSSAIIEASTDSEQVKIGGSDPVPQGYDSNRCIFTYTSKADKVAIVNAAAKVQFEFGKIKAIAATVPGDRIAALRKNPLISIQADPPRYSLGRVDPFSFSSRSDC